MKTLVIARTWDDRELPVSDRVTVRLSVEAERVRIWVDAPFHDDPTPRHAARVSADADEAHDGWLSGQSVPRLWEHEVVELFFLGSRDHYLEVELAPRGHYLVLQLEGRRNVTEQGVVIDYRARIDAARWRGEATFPTSLLPAGFDRLNATAIWGQGAARTYAMWRPCLGSEPDFHALSVFAPLDAE